MWETIGWLYSAPLDWARESLEPRVPMWFYVVVVLPLGVAWTAVWFIAAAGVLRFTGRALLLLLDLIEDDDRRRHN